MDDFHYTTRALSNPDILQRILSHLWPPSAAQAARVSRLWFGPATDNLWGQAPLDYLSDVEAGRRQIYASKLQQLSLNFNEDAAMAKGLQFPRIQSIDFHESTCDTDAATYEPQLTHLVLRKSRITDLFLHQVESTCHNLRSLRLDLLWAHYTDEALAALIAANPLLEHLHVKPRDRESSEAFAGDELHPLTDDVMDATLLQCARQRKLLSLRIGTDVNLKPEPFQRICDQVPEPFPLLRDFSGYVPSMAAPLLGQWCKHMHQLDLVFDDSEVPVLREISKMKNLQSMEIDLASGATICSLDMVSLQALSKLEVFSLICEDRSWPQLPLACDDFQKWMASFPNLNVFELEVNIGRHDHCTDGCLATLSRGWSRLERLTWPGTIHFGKLDLEDSTMPLFPNLEDLTVENATVSKDNQWFPKSVP